MHLPGALFSLLVTILTTPVLVHAEAAPSATPNACSIRSPSSGSFFDLRPLQVHPAASAAPEPTTPSNPDTEKIKPKSWHANGHDYPSNFTLNICGPVVEDLDDVAGIPEKRWQNISAFYRDHHGDTYSLGYENAHPIFRGRKLMLNYTNGSPCPELDEEGLPRTKLSATRRKNTLLSFVCDTSPSLTNHPSISFLGTPDHCTYVFEVRSRYACAGATGPSPEANSLGPASVFLVILAIAVLVYLVGGCVYQRNVMHQRGWRQLPNYGVWASCLSFIGDIFIIAFGSCTQRIPSSGRLFGGRGGGRYQRVNNDDRGGGGVRGRGRSNEDENRLIDELDEEWDG